MYTSISLSLYIYIERERVYVTSVRVCFCLRVSVHAHEMSIFFVSDPSLIFRNSFQNTLTPDPEELFKHYYAITQ